MNPPLCSNRSTTSVEPVAWSTLRLGDGAVVAPPEPAHAASVEINRASRAWVIFMARLTAPIAVRFPTAISRLTRPVFSPPCESGSEPDGSRASPAPVGRDRSTPGAEARRSRDLQREDGRRVRGPNPHLSRLRRRVHLLERRAALLRREEPHQPAP